MLKLENGAEVILFVGDKHEGYVLARDKTAYVVWYCYVFDDCNTLRCADGMYYPQNSLAKAKKNFRKRAARFLALLENIDQ